MANIAVEKTSFTYDEEHYHGSRERPIPSLVAHTYTHTATPQQRAIANPAPLSVSILALISIKLINQSKWFLRHRWHRFRLFSL